MYNYILLTIISSKDGWVKDQIYRLILAGWPQNLLSAAVQSGLLQMWCYQEKLIYLIKEVWASSS